jgi:hypothetical protein
MSSGLILLDEPATKRLIKAIESDLDLLVHLGDWLLHLNMFSDAQIYDILRFARSEIELFAGMANRGFIPEMTLCVCDSRWVSIYKKPRFLDTQISEEVEELPQPAVTHIFCNLSALWDRMKLRQNRGRPIDTGGVVEPA